MWNYANVKYYAATPWNDFYVMKETKNSLKRDWTCNCEILGFWCSFSKKYIDVHSYFLVFDSQYLCIVR